MKDKCHYGREVMRLAALLCAKHHAPERIFATAGLSPSLVRKLKAATAMPTNTAHALVTATLDQLLLEKLASLKSAPDKIALFFAQLASFDWLQLDPVRHHAHVNPGHLLAYAADRVDGRIYAKAGQLHLVLEFKKPLKEFSPVQLCQRVQPSRLGVVLRDFILKTLRDGCTELVLLVPDETAAQVLELYLDGALDHLDIVAACPDEPRHRTWRDGPPLTINLTSADAPVALDHRWRKALRAQPWVSVVEEVVNRLDLLRTLALPRHQSLAQTRRTIRIGAENFLSAAQLHVGALRSAAWRGFVQWPLLAAALLVALGHAAFSVAGLPLVFSLRGSLPGLVAGGAATGFFHATFFMAALMTGWAVGGRRAAIGAAGIEGAGGYPGFVLSRLLTA